MRVGRPLARLRRNPLKSGQCFLRIRRRVEDYLRKNHVAIPSNRVNVSYLFSKLVELMQVQLSRNPLKSGQCFLPTR